VPIPQLNDALRQRYLIVRELGRGGMATVYLARDLRHERTVALKLLNPDLTASLGPERFLREIRITAQLQHPHILALLDSGDEAGALWYTMPYVEGENLRQRIAREKQLGIGDALQIAGHVAAAIGYAHGRGIVHRDIKPENILLQSSGAMVADFGIARAVTAAADEKLTSTGLALGTPAYMSPEQGSGGHEVDARSDVYSLGCVVYEMLAGQPPFTASTAQGLLARHAVDPVPSLRTIRSTVPPPVARALEKALAKVPADRFASAEEFAAALTGTEADAADATALLPSRARAPHRRRAAAAVVIIAAGLATTLALWRRPHAAASTVVPSAAVIAVLPFTPSVPDTGLERLGRDLVLTVSPTLDGVGDIRTVDAHTVLAQSSPSASSSSLEKDQALARAFGAGSVLRGSVLKVGSQVRLDAGLVTSDSAAKTLARLSITAPTDSIEALTNGVIKALLPQIWRGGTAPSPSLDGALRTRSIAALRAFLEGERALMGNQWDEAADAFGRAIGADSSFWLAYQRYEYVVGWRYRPVDSAIDNALGRHLRDLPELERLMLEEPDTLKTASDRLARIERIAERFPTNWFARMQYADALFHWAPVLGHTRAEARAALEETLRLNPRFVPGWGHLIEAVLGDRDTVAAARAIDALTRLGAGPAFVEERGTDQLLQYRLCDRLLRGDANGAKALTDSVVRDVVAHGGGELLGPAFAGFFASEIAINRRLLPLVPDWKEGASRMVPYLWAGRGAWDSALVALDQFQKLRAGTDSTAPIRAYRLAAVGAWLGALPLDAAARRRVSAWAAARLLGGDALIEAAWLDGLLAIVRRDRRALDAARSKVHASALEAGDSSGFFDRSLGGFDLYLAGSSRQAGRALAALEWEQAEQQLSPRRFSVPATMPINRLAAAQWLLAAGDTAQASRLLNWVDTDNIGGFTWAALKGLVELQRGRIEDAQGHGDQALAHYRQFLARYDAPMPSQRPLVAEAREAVERLTHRGDPSPQ
jgi:TolB-like protein